MPLAEMKHEDKQELRRRVLLFFQKPHLTRKMNEQEPFSDGKFTNHAIRLMMYGLETAGLIYKIRGDGPGSVYGLTTDGYALIEVMDQIKAFEERENQSE